MEETPKFEGGSPSKSGPGELKGRTGSSSKSAPGKGIVRSLARVVAGAESGTFNAAPVQELANYKQLVARAVDVFGDEIKASKWLSLPNAELNGDTPLQVAQRDGYSCQVLEPIFTLIEHGIYF
jgi:Protein of unknown function (DUF2384)